MVHVGQDQDQGGPSTLQVPRWSHRSSDPGTSISDLGLQKDPLLTPSKEEDSASN